MKKKIAKKLRIKKVIIFMTVCQVGCRKAAITIVTVALFYIYVIILKDINSIKPICSSITSQGMYSYTLTLKNWLLLFHAKRKL